MTAQRPLFRDGERLTAQRLNDAFGFIDDTARRAQLGTLRPGVAVGYELSADATGPEVVLRIAPGLAIDGAGRFLVSSVPQLVSIREIEAQTGGLAVGARVLIKVQGRTPARSSTDPCAHLRPHVVEHAPEFRFERIESSFQPSAPSGMPAWSDLSGRTPDQLAVTLGSLTIVSDSGGFTVSMAGRAGVAARVDAVENTWGKTAIELADADGNPQVRLLARTFGDDVTATRVGAAGVSAASAAPSDGRVFLLDGGTAAVPVVLDPDSAPVDRAGIPLEMAPSKAGESVVRARRAGEQHVAVPLGVSAAPAYAAGEWTIVPVATAGLVSVVVRSASGIALGTPLAIADANTLVAVDRPPAVVVARAAQTSDSANASVELLAWINPPYHFAAPVIG